MAIPRVLSMLLGKNKNKSFGYVQTLFTFQDYSEITVPLQERIRMFMNEYPFPPSGQEPSAPPPSYATPPQNQWEPAPVKSYTAPTYDRFSATNIDTHGLPNTPPPKPTVSKEKRKVPLAVAVLTGTGASILSGVLVALIMVWSMGFGLLGTKESDNQSPSPDPSVSGASVIETGPIVVNGNSASAEAVAKKALPSVVSIATTAQVNNYFYGVSEQGSEGSGIVYTADGYVITNYHVIEAAVDYNGQVQVFLPSDTSRGHTATVVGYDISSDLAVVKIEATGLLPMEIGDSDALNVGQSAIAIGSPGGMDFMGSVSMGIISGLDRKLQLENSNTVINLIQTDAAINPGNSGGALVDAQGKLIGINSAKMAASNFEGMGFAIPVNHAMTIVDRIINNVDAPKPYMGIQLNTYYNGDTLKAIGYPAGVVVDRVVDGSPADNAGLIKYDIITHVNGVAVTSYTQFNSEKEKYKPGDTIELTVYRQPKTYTVQLTLGTANN